MRIAVSRFTLATLAFGTFILGSFRPAFAADISAGTRTVPLRGEVAVQYNQPDGTLKTVADGSEICVPSTTFESEPTGNAESGTLHCHTALSHPAHLDVKLSDKKVDLAIATVGNADVDLQGILDTGSGGMTLNAFQIFPASLVTSKGFNFNGQNQIVYKGITVTKLGATRNYGEQSSDPTSRTGNLGFAHLTFGDKGKLHTALVPILFIYSSSSSKPLNANSGDLDNTIGVNGALDQLGSDITYDGQPAQGTGTTGTVAPECTKSSMSLCSLISPFRALSYEGNVQAGYILTSFPLNEGQKGPYLTVGLDQRDTNGFSTVLLQCTTQSLNVESCNQEVHNVHVTSSAGLDFRWNVIFDSGRPTVGITVPTDESTHPGPTPVPAGVHFTVTPPTQTGYVYSFTAASSDFAATTRTYVETGTPNAANTFSNMGLEFFGSNSLLLDYDKGIEGWKAEASE